jgi:hypothetical protein
MRVERCGTEADSEGYIYYKRYKAVNSEGLWRWCVVKMTNLLDNIYRLFLIKTHNVSETGVMSPSSGVFYLMTGDRLQSPRCCVF